MPPPTAQDIVLHLSPSTELEDSSEEVRGRAAAGEDNQSSVYSQPLSAAHVGDLELVY